MAWFIGIGAGLLLLAAALFVWGYVRLQRNSRRLHEVLATVKVDDVPELAGTCAHVFASRLGQPLDASDPMACARALDAAVPSVQCTSAFARPDLEWAYVLHCGAYLGELVRMHGGGRWEAQADGAPGILIEHGDARLHLWPFEKVLKHRMQGDPGDLVAYLDVALRGPELLAAAKTGTDA
jgi:hypothetical protein